ncbi:uncharacterized protein V1518DRAFT_408300 [Limtongia smithiae]|uniref:uncharacterized protein n=1 Tax=Limtongia smithiae TaxID=1125753 RepID=UPI0034CE65BB
MRRWYTVPADIELRARASTTLNCGSTTRWSRCLHQELQQPVRRRWQMIWISSASARLEYPTWRCGLHTSAAKDKLVTTEASETLAPLIAPEVVASEMEALTAQSSASRTAATGSDSNVAQDGDATELQIGKSESLIPLEDVAATVNGASDTSSSITASSILAAATTATDDTTNLEKKNLRTPLRHLSLLSPAQISTSRAQQSTSFQPTTSKYSADDGTDDALLFEDVLDFREQNRKLGFNTLPTPRRETRSVYRERHEDEGSTVADKLLSGKDVSWGDFDIRREVLKGLKLQYPIAYAPTKVQTSLLSALQGQFSFIGVAPPGTGKTFALILHLLSQNRFKTPLSSVTSLVLVSTQELGFQYIEQIASFLRSGNATVPVDSVVQFLYRSDENTMLSQLERLKKNPTPHILIATPHRMVELLGNDRDRQYLNLSFIRTLAIDNAETLLRLNEHVEEPSRSKKKKLRKVKRSEKSARTVGVVNYILKLLRQVLDVYSLPDVKPQVVVLSSSVQSSKKLYKTVAQEQGWTKPEDTKLYGIANLRSPKPPGGDVKFINAAEKGTLDELMHMQHRSVIDARDKRPFVFTSSTAEILVDSLKVEYDADTVKRGLIIVPDTVPKQDIVDKLIQKGISSAILQFQPEGTKLMFKNRVIDTKKMFFGNQTDTLLYPNFIICGMRHITGLHFPGLSRVYVLGSQAAIQAFADPSKVTFLSRVVSTHELEASVGYTTDNNRNTSVADESRNSKVVVIL